MAPLAVAAKAPKVTDGVVHACLKTKGKKSQRGTIRVVSSPKQCKRKKGEKPLTWSLTGSAGAEGTPGPQGPAGAKGAAGATGTAGANGAAGVLEQTLKETIDNQSKEIQALLGKVGSLTTEVLDLKKDVGTVNTTVGELGTTVNKSLGDLKTELNGTIGGVKSDLEGTIGTVTGNLNTVTGTVNELKPLTSGVSELTGLPTVVTGLSASAKKTCQQVNTVGTGLETTGTALSMLGSHLTTIKVLGIPIIEAGEVPAAPVTIPKLTC